MRDVVLAGNGKARFDRGMDRILGASGLYPDIFLDRTVDEGKRRGLPRLQIPAKLTLSIVIAFWMFNANVWIRARHLDAVIALFHVCGKVGESELALELNDEIFKKRDKTDWRDRALIK
jgi:hypothetical protein